MLIAIVGGIVWFAWGGTPTSAPLGGRVQAPGEQVAAVEGEVDRISLERDLLARREEILRRQIAVLEQLGSSETVANDPRRLEMLRESRERLDELLADRLEADQWLSASLRQLWEVQDEARALAQAPADADAHFVLWPVEPIEGISAHFHDPAYQARFGLRHDAIDIPIPQGTDVIASADGIVAHIAERGMGYNALTVTYENGLTVVYGHVSEFLVTEGQRIEAGDILLLSGGTPGTPGAGALTTGPHLHFEVYSEGMAVDPLRYLPPHPNVAM
jgi:murein DD-endopeptidase MepM/ murein hydrolase activator NlpD